MNHRPADYNITFLMARVPLDQLLKNQLKKKNSICGAGSVWTKDLIWKWARSWSLTAGVALLRKFYRDFPMGRPYCLIRLNGTEEQTCSLIVNCGNRTQAASAGRMSSIDSASAWQLIISLSVCKSIKIFTKKSKQNFWQIEKNLCWGLSSNFLSSNFFDATGGATFCQTIVLPSDHISQKGQV